MSAESPFPTDLTMFVPARHRLVDYLKKDLKLSSSARSRFFLVNNYTKVNALNGIARRALVEAYAENPTWKNVSAALDTPVSDEYPKMLGPKFSLKDEAGFRNFRFFVSILPSPDTSAIVQIVKNDVVNETDEFIGGPKFIWLPEGSNGNVEVQNPINDERIVTNKNAGLCAVQGLAAVFFNSNFNRDYLA